MPRYPWPNKHPRLDDPLWTMAVHLGPAVAEPVRKLERSKQDDEFLWRTLSRMSFDGWCEKLMQVGLAQAGETVTLSPTRFGCALQVVSGRTGRDLSKTPRPAVVLQHGALSAVVWQQATVRVAGGHLRTDLLAVIAQGGRRRTVVVEIFSDQTHPDRGADARRARRLGVPVGRLHVDGVVSGKAVDAMLTWMASKLPR